MPLYQSKTGKNVIVHLGRDKKKILVSTTPTQLPYANLHKLFPKLVEKTKDDPMPVPDNILEQARQRLLKQQLDQQVFNEIERQIGTVVDYRNTQLQTRMWAGQRCFIVAGGPSLIGFDFNKLQGERVIAINKAFVDIPFADIQLSMDKQFYFWLTDPKKANVEMQEAIVKWPDFQGHKVWVKMPGVDVLKGVECVKFAGNEGLSTSLEDGIYAGSNSGYAAINLAVALGANPIYLLGYDMKHDAKGRSHYHGGYTKPQKTNQLHLFSKKFPKLAEDARKRGIKIVNLNRRSALNCFEFGDVDGVLASPQVQIITDNIWKNKRCFLIGGGPSLKNFNFNLLKGEKTIAINRAIEYTPFADIFFSMDYRMYEWLFLNKHNKLLDITKKALLNYKGVKSWLNTGGFHFKSDVVEFPLAGISGISSSLQEGLYSGKNSGFAALNLAICLGANPIYLLGYDMTSDKKENNFHSGYGYGNNFDPESKGWIKIFEENAPIIKQRGIEVINLNPHSNLKCFPFGNIDDIALVDKDDFIVCSFYTPDYKSSALRLQNKLQQLAIPYDLVEIKKGATTYQEWRNITMYKAAFVKEMLLKHTGKNIVWTDADSVFHQYPQLFNNFPGDISARIYNTQLLSGTVYFKNNNTVHKIVDEWIIENTKEPDVFRCTQEQRNLQAVIERNKNKINFRQLPKEYCVIFDEKNRPTRNIVVEHFQESRKFRGRK